MQRLAGPLKLLVWGGAELHQLCTAPMVGPNSVFHRLTRMHVEPFSREEVARLLHDHLGTDHGAEDMYSVTHGHPALVHEALEVTGEAARLPSLDDLRARLLTGVYLHHLKSLIDREPALQAILQRVRYGDTARRADPAEARLCWLGVASRTAAWPLGLDSAHPHRLEPPVVRLACVVGLMLGLWLALVGCGASDTKLQALGNASGRSVAPTQQHGPGPSSRVPTGRCGLARAAG